MSWKRVFMIATLAFLVSIALNVGQLSNYYAIRDIAEDAIATASHYGQVIIEQETVIDKLEAEIAHYEEMLGHGPEDGFTKLEAIEFVDYCIRSHEQYYDQAVCDKYGPGVGDPEFHKWANENYSLLRGYIVETDG